MDAYIKSTPKVPRCPDPLLASQLPCYLKERCTARNHSSGERLGQGVALTHSKLREYDCPLISPNPPGERGTFKRGANKHCEIRSYLGEDHARQREFCTSATNNSVQWRTPLRCSRTSNLCPFKRVTPRQRPLLRPSFSSECSRRAILENTNSVERASLPFSPPSWTNRRLLSWRTS